jgi:hypothetical protein
MPSNVVVSPVAMSASAFRTGRADGLQTGSERRGRHRDPVDLRHLPRLAQTGPERPGRREVDRVVRDAVGLDVVGVAVVAELVVRHDDVGTRLADDLDEQGGRLGEVGVPERVLVDLVGRGRVAVLVPLHAGVAEATGSTQQAVVGDPELGHRIAQLADAVLTQQVVAVRRQVLELRHEDLTHLTQRARHERHGRALGHVLRHRHPVGDRLVVGMGVHEQDPTIGRGHGARLLASDGA